MILKSLFLHIAKDAKVNKRPDSTAWSGEYNSTALCQNLQKDENTRVSVKHVPPCMEKKGWDKSLNQECRVQSQEPRIIAWP